MKMAIERNKDNYWVAYVDGKPVVKRKDIVACAKKLYAYLKGQA